MAVRSARRLVQPHKDRLLADTEALRRRSSSSSSSSMVRHNNTIVTIKATAKTITMLDTARTMAVNSARRRKTTQDLAVAEGPCPVDVARLRLGAGDQVLAQALDEGHRMGLGEPSGALLLKL
jgi:hypothetical protein